MTISSKIFVPTTSKGIGDNYGRLYPQFARAGAVFLYYWFGYTQKGNQENGYIILPLLDMNYFFRRSRNWNRSHYFQDGVEVGAGVA